MPFLRFFFLLFLIVSNFSFGQTRSYFPGTKLSIEQPSLSKFDNVFPLLLDEKGLYAITVNEYMFYDSIEGIDSSEKMFQEFDSTTTTKRGVKVFNQWDFPIGKCKGMLIHAKLNTSSNSLNLLFRGSDFVVIVSTNYNSSDSSLLNKILEIYRSINYNVDLKINWNDYSPLNISEKSGFQLAEKQFSSSVLKYIPLHTKQDSCFVLVSKIPNEGRFYNLDEFVKFIILPQFENSFELKEIVFEEKKEIGVNQVHFLKVECFDSDRNLKIIHFAFWLNKKYGVALSGISSKSNQEYLSNFYKDFNIKEL